MINDDGTVSVLDCVYKSLSEVESSASDNEIGDNQDFDCRSDISNSEHVEQGTQLVSRV
jgi:hypothetical protein